MRVGPPDCLGVHLSAGEKKRTARWTQATVLAEFENRIMRLAAELTAISSNPLRLFATIMVDRDLVDILVTNIFAHFAELDYQVTQNGQDVRLQILPDPNDGWRKLQKKYPPHGKRKVRK